MMGGVFSFGGHGHNMASVITVGSGEVRVGSEETPIPLFPAPYDIYAPRSILPITTIKTPCENATICTLRSLSISYIETSNTLNKHAQH